MSIFDDFENLGRRMQHFRDAAAKAPKGLPIEQLVPGAIVTVSACKATGDRSWTDCIWEVMGNNNGHALMKWRAGSKPYGDTTRLMQVYEREFYPAEHLLEDMAFGASAPVSSPEAS